MIEQISVTKDLFPISFTPKALSMAKEALEESEAEDGNILRINIAGGGCAGMKYALTFVKEVDQLDVVSDIEGLTVAADVFSFSHLKGTKIDYSDSLQGSGFRFDNPNAKRSCGCGSSFS